MLRRLGWARALGLLVVSASLGTGLAACDRQGKEGDQCKTPTFVAQEQSDCEPGLVCAQCDRGPECVRADGARSGDRLNVPGRVCNVLRDLRTESDIPRGQVP